MAKDSTGAWPTLILIDQQGVIVGRYAGIGGMPVEDLEKVLEQIFPPAPVPKKHPMPRTSRLLPTLQK